jgi:hypothetical protein
MKGASNDSTMIMKTIILFKIVGKTKAHPKWYIFVGIRPLQAKGLASTLGLVFRAQLTRKVLLCTTDNAMNLISAA